MTCPTCKTEFEGPWCPACGNVAQAPPEGYVPGYPGVPPGYYPPPAPARVPGRGKRIAAGVLLLVVGVPGALLMVLFLLLMPLVGEMSGYGGAVLGAATGIFVISLLGDVLAIVAGIRCLMNQGRVLAILSTVVLFVGAVPFCSALGSGGGTGMLVVALFLLPAGCSLLACILNEAGARAAPRPGNPPGTWQG